MEEDLLNVFEYFDPHLENEPLNLINIGKPVLQHPPHVPLLKKKHDFVKLLKTCRNGKLFQFSWL